MTRGAAMKTAKYVISLGRLGCTNRPFYQIVVTPFSTSRRKFEGMFIEQLGTFDPIPNEANEKLCALNFERLKFWIAKNSAISQPLLELLGLCGFFPVHPLTYIRAKKQRKINEEIEKKIAEKSQEAPEAAPTTAPAPAAAAVEAKT